MRIPHPHTGLFEGFVDGAGVDAKVALPEIKGSTQPSVVSDRVVVSVFDGAR